MTGGLEQSRAFGAVVVAALAGLGLVIPIRCAAEEKPSCTCSDGRNLAPGAVSYTRNSDRESITRVEAEGNSFDRQCRVIWIGSTEIHPEGTPYEFYLERSPVRERRFEGCGESPDRFLKRNRTYEFVFDSDSVSIREMRLTPPPSVAKPATDPGSESNATLWNSISAETSAQSIEVRKSSSQTSSGPEFTRTAWVLARKDITAHSVGVVKDIAQGERLVPLKSKHKVQAGQLGQIEASNADRAIVRFYQGSRIQRFAKTQNALRRWYDRIGGPYAEIKDDLYTSIRAYIVEVSLADVIEVNDYLDQDKANRT